jgi:hypothetical protein
MKRTPMAAIKSSDATSQNNALIHMAGNLAGNENPRALVPKGKASTDHPEPKQVLMQDVGAKDKDFLHGYMRHMWEANARGGEIDVMDFRFALSYVEDLKPKNQLEGALALQMAMTHLFAMRFAQRLSTTNNIPELELCERIFTKMTRSYVAQMDALNAHRNKNAPGVTVQNFSVKDVGQAIVGNIKHNARADVPGVTAASPSAITDAKATPMPRVTERQPVRVPRVRPDGDG